MMNVFTFRPQHGLRFVVLAVVMLSIIYWLIRNLRSTDHSYKTGDGGEDLDSLDHRSHGLWFKGGEFYINNNQVRLYSGAMHYFRIVPEYWKDRLLKLRAAGLNTVETYVPWNLHEEIRGQFNFEGRLNIRAFVKLAQEVGLYVIVRPGPYICSEWDFGGLPSWLLNDPQMVVRSTYPPFIKAAALYLEQLSLQITDLQFQRGGPIIAFQIENEYGSYGNELNYMQQLKKSLEDHHYDELLFTSDNEDGSKRGSIPGVLNTVNLQSLDQAQNLLSWLKNQHPDWPRMVMEFWSGWFDHWGEGHHTWPPNEFESVFKYIISEGASVNLYMFHGGTNFGFMNGANNPYTPTITSYDYDAPLSESGDITDKFHIIRKVLQAEGGGDMLDIPPPIPKFSYGNVKTKSVLYFKDILSIMKKPLVSKDVMAMESLPINNGGGQGYGFVLYRAKIPKGTLLKIQGSVRDRAQIFVNGFFLGTQGWHVKDHIHKIDPKYVELKVNTLDIFVENLGRINYGENVLDKERKGLLRGILLDDKLIENWAIYPLEFKEKFIKECVSSSKWQTTEESKVYQPSLFRGSLNIIGPPKDTFINMEGWEKGVVFINSFNIGRYWNIGPQKTLYVPAPLLRTGKNSIVVFELHQAKLDVTFQDSPIL